MRLAIMMGVPLLVLGVNQAAAQSCTPGSILGSTALTTVLSNNYACAGTPGNLEWNELHQGGASGTIQDYKMGPSSQTDPSAVVGTYSIGGTTKAGTVTYTYYGGGSGAGPYVYNVQLISGNSYAFCQTSPTTNVYTITVQPTHC